jgi:hypothetical protein
LRPDPYGSSPDPDYTLLRERKRSVIIESGEKVKRENKGKENSYRI